VIFFHKVNYQKKGGQQSSFIISVEQFFNRKGFQQTAPCFEGGRISLLVPGKHTKAIYCKNAKNGS
jgi:hypothetical protein